MSVVEQLEGEMAGLSGKTAGGAARFGLVADSEEIRGTAAVAVQPGSSVAALDLDDLYTDSAAVHQ